MRSVNTVVLPEYSNDLIIRSIKEANLDSLKNDVAEKQTAIDFYYNRNIDKHIEEWFEPKTLEQIPSFGQRIVPRFARARMMLYKEPPKRLIRGEESDDYKQLAYMLNSKTREFAELSWLNGEMGFRSRWNEKRKRIEYDIIGFYRKYFIEGESDHFAVSYEVKSPGNERLFVFFSEPRDGQPGLHFKFTQGGRILQINEDHVNDYGVIPVSFASYPANAHDVIRMAVQVGIAYTEIALATRFSFGQPVVTGVDAIDPEHPLKMGIDVPMILPNGANFQFVTPGGSLTEMIEAAKSFANQAAINHSLRIKWDESGNPPSGAALRLMEVENLESRISDIPIWREWENQRYEIDRTIIKAETDKDLGENYSVDFSEVEFPKTAQEEREQIDWEMEKGLMTREDLIRWKNPDISDEDLQAFIERVDNGRKKEAEAQKPKSPLERILNA